MRRVVCAAGHPVARLVVGLHLYTGRIACLQASCVASSDPFAASLVGLLSGLEGLQFG